MAERNDERRPPVLLATMSLGLGGAETHVTALATGLKLRGWKVIVASAGGYQVQELERHRVKHVEIPLNSRSPLKMHEGFLHLLRTVRTEHVRLVHAHARIPGYLSRHVARRYGIPLVMTYHFPFKSGFPWKLFSPGGDITIAVSEDIRTYINKEFGIPLKSTVVIPNGVDTSFFRPPSCEETLSSRRHFGLDPAEGPVIAYASRLAPELGRAAVAAVRAVGILARTFPKVVLLVAGDGTALPEVRNEAETQNSRLGRNAVRVLGLVEDMLPVYWASSLVVGMSRVALEAMACARPVLIAGPAGVCGTVREDNLDFLALRNFTSRNAVEPLDPLSIAYHATPVLASPGTAASLARLGRDTVVRSYSVDFMVSQTESVYRVLLEERDLHR